MNVLQQKIGPLPAWAWGGIAAVAVWFFFLRQPGGSSGTSGTSAGSVQGNALNSGYSLGYAQGLQNAAPGVNGSVTQPSPIANAVKLIAGSSNPGLQQYGQNIPIYRLGSYTKDGVTYGAQPVATIPFGTNLNSNGAPVSVPWGTSTATLIPVDYLGQSGYYVSSSDIAYANGAGIGGPRKFSAGSRAAAPLWSDAHPLIGAPVQYSHYVRAVGGPGNHQNEVHRVARQSGVHPARIAMLNPTPTALIRVA